MGKAGEGTAFPQALRPWASDRYAVRYFLQVEPPPAAGATGVLPEPQIASLYLPLRLFPADPPGQPRIEQILLLDETGQPQPIFMRPVTGGNEVEIAFPTRLARRRYCLYAGAADGRADQASPSAFQPRALTVRVRGYSAPGAWRKNAPPMNREQLDRTFQSARQLGEALRRQIYDADPPFGDPYRRSRNLDGVTPVLNDKNYAALYEGYLRAPLSGTYHFAVNTFGIVDLQVDGTDVLSAGKPDESRQLLSLTGQTDLRAGIHRVTMRYAQAGGTSGVYLLWKPPGARDFLAVPGQVFPRALPAVVIAREDRGQATPFIHVELLGFYRTGVSKGIAQAREWVTVFARTTGVEDAVLQVRAPGEATVKGASSGLCAIAPAGQLIEIECRKGDESIAQRAVLFPTDQQGGRDLMDLTGELVVKEAPRFLYPDEIAQFHFEAQVSPIQRIVPKERYVGGPEVPPFLPAGQFRLTWRLTGAPQGVALAHPTSGERLVTPGLTGRRKIRLPIETGPLEKALRKAPAQIELTLTIGGVPTERRTYRILHSRADWNGRLEARLDGLTFLPATEKAGGEEPLFLLPREDPAAYRRFQLGLLGSGTPTAADALFLGDPLVESDEPPPADKAVGLSARLVTRMAGSRWSHRCLPGPHRGYYVFRLLAAADELVRSAKDGKLPPVVVVSLGAGDMRSQTPGYDFERGLDLLVDRLRKAGVKRIFIVGVLPLPDEEKASRLYQHRVADVIRQQRLGGLDLVTAWLSEPEWSQRFRIPNSQDTAPAYAPVPNAETLDQIAKQVIDRLK